MTVITRRGWLQAAAAAGGGAAIATVHSNIAEAGQARTPAAPKPGYPSRPAGKIEMLFKAPGRSANGMQCTEEGIWRSRAVSLTIASIHVAVVWKSGEAVRVVVPACFRSCAFGFPTCVEKRGDNSISSLFRFIRTSSPDRCEYMFVVLHRSALLTTKRCGAGPLARRPCTATPRLRLAKVGARTATLGLKITVRRVSDALSRDTPATAERARAARPSPARTHPRTDAPR